MSLQQSPPSERSADPDSADWAVVSVIGWQIGVALTVLAALSLSLAQGARHATPTVASLVKALEELDELADRRRARTPTT